jgi:hypothetical protein
MHTRGPFDGLISLETLHVRLSPTSPLVVAVQPQIVALVSNLSDPLPDPEPSPGPYPGNDPPIDGPQLPPSGPVGPGSSQG